MIILVENKENSVVAIKDIKSEQELRKKSISVVRMHSVGHILEKKYLQFLEMSNTK